MSHIIPRSKAKGTDICAFNNYYYIIRSDLGRYMQTSDLNKGADISIFNLHPNCQNGDHYIGGDSYFHIISGNSCRRVSNLSTDSGAVVFSLHPNCRGGDHYFASYGYFYIIFQEKGIYRRARNLTDDTDAEVHPLHPSFRDGVYYWGSPYHKKTSECFSFLKPEFFEFCTGPDLSTDEGAAVYSVDPIVIKFLTEGLSVTGGRATGM